MQVSDITILSPAELSEMLFQQKVEKLVRFFANSLTLTSQLWLGRVDQSVLEAAVKPFEEKGWKVIRQPASLWDRFMVRGEYLLTFEAPQGTKVPW